MNYIFEIGDTWENQDYPIAVYQELKNGAKSKKKYMTIEDLVTALLKPMVNYVPSTTATGIDSFENETAIPLLPPGTINYSNAKGKVLNERVTMIVEKGIWPVTYSSYVKSELVNKTYLLGLPKLAVQHVLSSHGNALNTQRRVVSSSIYALRDDKRVTADTPLFTFPFPNVNKGNGTVCWGGNTVELIVPSLCELDSVFTTFTLSPFSEDYGMVINANYDKFYEYLEENDNKPFNDEFLIPTSRGLTIKDLYGKTTLNGAV